MKCPYCNQKCSVDSRASFHVFCEQAYDVGHADALAEVALTEEAIVALHIVADGGWREITAGKLEYLYQLELIDVRYNLTALGRAALAAARKETP